jgi:sialate O-acetylesterase
LHIPKKVAMKKIIYCFLIVILGVSSLSAQLKISKLFSNNAILQRGLQLPVWGTAKPGETITVNFNNLNFTTITQDDGKWNTILPKMEAGGPYSMMISTNTEKTTFENILIGDVWLCSGQSNMEWQLTNSNNAETEIANANDDQIRHFMVPHSYSFLPQDTLAGGTWEICSPETAGDFTAVGYFFAKELRKHHNVPIGLLHSSWGGSRIEPWMRAEILGYSDAQESAKVIQSYMDSIKNRTILELEKKLGKLPTEDMGMKNDFPLWASPDYNHSSWKTMELPGAWESKGYEKLDGVLWFRKEIFLTKDETQNDLMLNLGTIDDSDITYFNGQKIGSTDAYNVNRNYIIPAADLIEGVNIVTVRIIDYGWNGGFMGECEDFFYKSSKGKTAICGQWYFNVGLVDLKNTARPNQYHTLLYNQMINPIIDFPIKGVIWYQGESNAGFEDAKKYQEQFPAMITDWRRLWKCGDFPFLWVQLANWQQAEAEPSDHGWARLREAQSMTLSLPNTAQAVTIDIGEAEDIHPRNKQDVGLRLALGARKIAYNEDLIYSGPVYKSMQIEGNTIRLSFELFGGKLASKNGEILQTFEIAGPDKKFYWAQAKIEGDQVIVRNKIVDNPVAVRYAWSINPENANLYNSEDNPASPFRTDDW